MQNKNHSLVLAGKQVSLQVSCKRSNGKQQATGESPAVNHLLRGSGSTAVNGDRITPILDPHKIPLNRSPKICHRRLRRRPLPQYLLWRKSTHRGFWANGCITTNFL